MELIEKQIIEAATWIEKINPNFSDNCFRSPGIKHDGEIFTNPEYNSFSKENFASTILKRRSILNDRGVKYLQREDVAKKGILVFSCPEETENDGGAQFYSQGYFDNNDVPPWDTWVSASDQEKIVDFRSTFLMASWVPNDLISQVSSGKEVCIRDIIFWGSEVIDLKINTPFLQDVCRKPVKFAC